MVISPFDSARGLPCSLVRISARSSACANCSSAHLRMIALRSLAVLARHAGHALFAASIARRVSPAPMTGVDPAAVDVTLLPEQRGILERERRSPFESVGGHGSLLRGRTSSAPKPAR